MLYNGGAIGDIELGDVIKSSLIKIAKELERANDLKEKELEMKRRENAWKKD